MTEGETAFRFSFSFYTLTMIRMIQSQSAAHAKAYFSDALAKSDYYLSDQELEGFWQGKLADRLKLSGATDSLSEIGFSPSCLFKR